MRENLLDFDRSFLGQNTGIIGIDEAGRGALAGPVSAAGVYLSKKFYKNAHLYEDLISSIDDSKKLSEQKRDILYKKLFELNEKKIITFTQQFASVKEIEELNILGATKLAMQRCLDDLKLKLAKTVQIDDYSFESELELFANIDENVSNKALVMVDGKALSHFKYKHINHIKGDAKSFAIAASSIIAKVSRDVYMNRLSLIYPHYEFEKHKGYCTALHRQNILCYGALDVHRKLFLRTLYLKDKQDDLNL